MTQHLFITATDTDAGKTLVACTLTSLLAKNNKVACFKPISAGCEWQEGELINEDAKLLQQMANCQQPLASVNPIAFEEPIAPHIAAQTIGKTINCAQVVEHFNGIAAYSPEIIVTEGAGGWRLPLGNGEYLSDFAQQTQQQVILVVNMKLGCLNHAILTYQAIEQDGLKVVGWVANCIEPMAYQTENINELIKTFSAPLLGKIPNVKGIQAAAECLDANLL